MHVIETEKFTLQPQVVAHAEEMFVVLSDAAIYEFENEPPQSIEFLRARFAKLESRFSPDGQERWLNWVIRLPASQIIGYVQATIYSDGLAEIAYVLSSDYWGQGLASEAVRVMIANLIENYQISALSAVLKQGNFRSLRLLERLGFSMASSKLHGGQLLEPNELLFQREANVHASLLKGGEC